MLAKTLARDLINRYSFMPFTAVKLAFENGTRDTERFVISPATWCKWLNKIKQEVWEGWHHFELGTHHAIQKEIKMIMNKQPKLLMEYKNK